MLILRLAGLVDKKPAIPILGSLAIRSILGSDRARASPYVRLGTQSTGFELIILACRGRISTVEKTKVKIFVFLSLASAANQASGVGRGRISLVVSPPFYMACREF